jgi:hypothetical protein
VLARTEASESQKKCGATRRKRQKPAFFLAVLLPTDDDLVRLDSPWAIRPYANQ